MTRETRSWSRIQRSASGTLVVGFFALLGLTPDLSAQSQASVTFARDVAPILQQKCEACHRDGSIDPMPLTNYEEVRPWAPMIKEKVVSLEMPPWPIDRTIGIQRFKNDRSLSEEQISSASGCIRGTIPRSSAQLAWTDSVAASTRVMDSSRIRFPGASDRT